MATNTIVWIVIAVIPALVVIGALVWVARNTTPQPKLNSRRQSARSALRSFSLATRSAGPCRG